MFSGGPAFLLQSDGMRREIRKTTIRSRGGIKFYNSWLWRRILRKYEPTAFVTSKKYNTFEALFVGDSILKERVNNIANYACF